MNKKKLKILFIVIIVIASSLIRQESFAAAASDAGIRESLPPALARLTAYHYENHFFTLESGETYECAIPLVNQAYFEALERKYGSTRRQPFFGAPSEPPAAGILRMPFSSETLETEDPPFNPYRKKAFDDLEEVVEILAGAKRSNFDESYKKAAEKVYGGMLRDYANYSDICLAARLCLIDAIAAEYGCRFFSGSPFRFEYEQIRENYAHEPCSKRRSWSVSDEIDYGRGAGSRFRIMDANLKKLIGSIDSRLAAIKANDGEVSAKIDELKAEIARALETAREADAKIRSGKGPAGPADEYCGAARKWPAQTGRQAGRRSWR